MGEKYGAGRVGYLDTPRLRMIAANTQLVSADLQGRAALARELDIEVPANWPPDLYDHQALKYALTELAEPSTRGWFFWYLQLREPAARQLIGICGFKGRPDARGSVEIGYSILSQFRQRGFASEAVQGLVGWAFSHSTVSEVTAETFPYLSQSIGVLRKCGFRPAGRGSEQGVVRYAIDRSAFR
jgi:RimJ/RimL family protein N-acetyltransferase